MKTIKIISFSGLFIIFFLSVPFLFLFNKKLAYYSYKEVVYRIIINNTVGREKEPKKISLLLLDYFHYYLFTPVEAVVVDKDVYHDLIRGIAWCDQRSWAMSTFLGKLGIDSRMVMARNPEGVSNHTVLEVLIDKKWRFFDPMYGFIAEDNNGELASYEDICHDPSLFYLNPDMLLLKEILPYKYQKVKDYFLRNIFINSVKPIIWGDPIKNKGLTNRIIIKVLDFYICLFGNSFSYLYQDVYQKYYPFNNKDDCAFLKARNYDLFDRYQLAIDGYRNYINNVTGGRNSEDALFFLGLLYNKKQELKLSIDTLQTLLRKYPQTKWRRISWYYLGFNYQLSNNYQLAKECYWRAIDMYEQLKEDRLIPEELKAIRGLYNLLSAEKQRAGTPNYFR